MDLNIMYNCSEFYIECFAVMAVFFNVFSVLMFLKLKEKWNNSELVCPV